MKIILVDPVGEVEKVERRETQAIRGLQGKKVGFVFNQQMAAHAFWKKLEDEVQRTLQPEAVRRIHKDNTYAPITPEAVEQMVRDTDYALVGVGA